MMLEIGYIRAMNIDYVGNAIYRLSVSAELLKAWLALTNIKYRVNLMVFVVLNQWLVLTML